MAYILNLRSDFPLVLSSHNICPGSHVFFKTLISSYELQNKPSSHILYLKSMVFDANSSMGFLHPDGLTLKTITGQCVVPPINSE